MLLFFLLLQRKTIQKRPITPDKKLSPVSFEFAARVLTNKNEMRLSVKTPFQPSAGNVYLYNGLDDVNDFLADGYSWSKIISKTVAVSGSPILRETYYINMGKLRNKGFQRHVFTLKSSPSFALVQYVGDHSLFVSLGNNRLAEKKLVHEMQVNEV